MLLCSVHGALRAGGGVARRGGRSGSIRLWLARCASVDRGRGSDRTGPDVLSRNGHHLRLRSGWRRRRRWQGATVAAAARGIILGTRPPPPRLAVLSRSPSRWAPTSLAPGLHRAAPAAAAAEGRVGEGPAWVELEPIGSEQQLDRALAEAQQRDVPIVLLWTVSWCRKCIYLKPKLEKFAADYYPRIQFYCVDVNAVPQKLVNRAGVTKMPSIQMWSDSQKQAEVIGGHKSLLVIDDVRRMIEQEE